MARLYSGFWVGVTTLLSIIFTVMFFPIVQEKYGYPKSVVLTMTGLVVIWASYFVRAYIFTQAWGTGPAKTKENQGID